MTSSLPIDHPCLVCGAIPGEQCEPTSAWDSANGGGYHGIRGLWPQPILTALATQPRRQPHRRVRSSSTRRVS